MRSIGARLTLFYALGATVSFAVLSLIGGALLHARLIRGLDELNAAEFRQLKEHVGADYPSLTPAQMAKRLSHISEFQSVLFYISIDRPFSEEAIFQSHNMRGYEIPDVKGRHPYSAQAVGLGPLRVQEFALPPYDVTVATSAQSVTASIRAYAITSVALIGIMLIVSILIGLAMRGVVLRPIRAIRETAERIRSDNLGERIAVSEGNDEISDLAALLNRMFDRLEGAFIQMRHFSEEVSHELKTPLSLLRLHAEDILKSGYGDHGEAALEQIEEIARLNRFIDQMLFLSRAEADAIAFDLRSENPRLFLESFAHDAVVLAESAGLTFTLRQSGDGEVAIDTSWFRQVLLNILTNAIRVSPPDGRILLTATFSADQWRLSLEDEGQGLNPDQCERIFERFVRLQDITSSVRGAGLGLTISRTVVRLHHGQMWAEPACELGGLALIVALPRSDNAVAG